MSNDSGVGHKINNKNLLYRYRVKKGIVIFVMRSLRRFRVNGFFRIGVFNAYYIIFKNIYSDDNFFSCILSVNVWKI